jgi:hypothetical protein
MGCFGSHCFELSRAQFKDMLTRFSRNIPDRNIYWKIVINFSRRSFVSTLDQANQLLGNAPFPADLMKENAKW